MTTILKAYKGFSHYQRAIWIWVAVAVLLPACAQKQIELDTHSAALAARQAQLAPFTQWGMHASAKVISSGGKYAFALRWHCSTRERRCEFEAYSKQHKKLLHLSVFPDRALLTDQRGRKYEDTDAQALLQRVTRINIPIYHLCHWAIGIPYPKASGQTAQLVVDDAGLLSEMKQSGWHIEYLQYAKHQRDNAMLVMPAEMVIDRNDIKIHLSIRRYTKGTPI